MSSVWEIGNLSVSQSNKIKDYLELPTVEEKLPAFLINGSEEGPKVLVLGGIHGCEYTSIDAAQKVGTDLIPSKVKGKVIVLPIANPASFYARSIYVHPRDQKNVNRMFPGKEDGTDAERLAYWLNEMVFKKVDYIIDLHGGDMIEALVPFTIYHVTEDERVIETSKQMASLFDIDYVIGSSGQVPGSTYGCAAEQGTPAIIAEAGQQGILSEEHSVQLQDGVKNILVSLELLEGEVKQSQSTYISVFDWYRSDFQGLWYPSVVIGQSVTKGQVLGKLTNEFGETVKEIISNTEGVVLFLVSSLAINDNDPLLAVGA
ncbi:M14 family metallopeptidase [Aquibacillus koreensis]|uniref:M14 family metallopeptidase n=1 Tax=Aquibacillus koreensis TaxID=279446 RepID=A0A9X3WM97_9BACI|nr:M14 family metallopeptidase [Aquibacillus koreensis]MCT2537093.1 M14 family metallopeptidase [Aquibacillus koreensis]MDC3419924.1 M14 family metallopeptidase [Aquibacillus koreensis]